MVIMGWLVASQRRSVKTAQKYGVLKVSYCALIVVQPTIVASSRGIFCLSCNQTVLCQGYIVTVKEGYGFIRCTDRDARMFFHYSEMLDVDREIKLQQEVEFTIIPVVNAF